MMTFHSTIEIPATPEVVFAAIGDPQRLARWWGPKGFTNTFHECDFRKGGKWSFTMHGPDGSSYPNECAFAEIEAPGLVVVEHVSEPRFRLVIELAASGAETNVSWAQTFVSEEMARRLEPIVVPANQQNLERLSAEVLRG